MSFQKAWPCYSSIRCPSSTRSSRSASLASSVLYPVECQEVIGCLGQLDLQQWGLGLQALVVAVAAPPCQVAQPILQEAHGPLPAGHLRHQPSNYSMCDGH